MVALTLAPVPARATGIEVPSAPDLPASSTLVIPPGASHASDRGQAWTPDRTRFFIGGGTGILSSKSLVNAWLLRSWNLTAGCELAGDHTWTLIPRLHLSGASGSNTGSILWARLALDGRVTRRGGGLRTYQEGGIGISVLDSPVSVTDASFQAHEEQRTSGAPFVQLVSGFGGTPGGAVVYQFELILVLGAGAERPSGIEVVAGLAF